MSAVSFTVACANTSCPSYGTGKKFAALVSAGDGNPIECPFCGHYWTVDSETNPTTLTSYTSPHVLA